MQPIQFIKNLSWENGLWSTGHDQIENQIFIRQGDLDGACAVYSLMMMLMIHNKVNLPELVDRQKAIKATDGGYNSYMRLQKQFLSGIKGLYREGYHFSELAAELKTAFKNKATATTYEAFRKKGNSVAKKDLTTKIKETIDAGFPVELGVSYRYGGGHAMLAIGYTRCKYHLRFFCLDPSFNMPKLGYWNSIVDMPFFVPANSIYCDSYYKEDEKEPVSVAVDEIMTIDV